ncbi:MAG TPA: hypothetical protein VFA65_24315 [Bryobacteraceae bacterium]|nr:hypothetical protein [Bryobacteraceae bacterium]
MTRLTMNWDAVLASSPLNKQAASVVAQERVYLPREEKKETKIREENYLLRKPEPKPEVPQPKPEVPLAPVRIATSEDADSLMACLRMMHDENGLFSFSEELVRKIINDGISPPAGLTFPPMVGVIGPPGDVEATTCLMLSRLYYTEEWHLGDLWHFIRPDCRKKNHIVGLLEFAKQCADKIGLSLMSGVVSNKRTEAKVRIFSRHFGAPLGALFIYRPNQKAS